MSLKLSGMRINLFVHAYDLPDFLPTNLYVLTIRGSLTATARYPLIVGVPETVTMEASFEISFDLSWFAGSQRNSAPHSHAILSTDSVCFLSLGADWNETAPDSSWSSASSMYRLLQ